MSTEVRVSELPECDFCRTFGQTRLAAVDGKTNRGPWANMCDKHFKLYGLGLGTGLGQRLTLRSQSEGGGC